MKRSLLLCAGLLLACNRDPIGFDQLERLPAARAVEFEPENLGSYCRHVPLGAADPMPLGRDAEYQSRVLLQFAIRDSALDSVASLQLILHPQDSTAMAFVCRPCSTPWSSAGATWRMADEENQWAGPGGDYWPFELGADTLGPDSLVTSLDVRYLDTLVHRSYGIILFPLDTGFCRIRATASAAQVRVTFADGTSQVYAAGDDCPIMDTLAVRASPYDLHVGSGVAFRAWLHFNVDSIPREATIARADLVFGPRVLYQRRETLQFGCHRLTEPYRPKERNAGYRTAADARTVFVPADTADTIVRLDIRALVQHWTANPDSNFGLLVMAEPEYALPWRVKLPRTGAAAPRLAVEYVLPPDDRFSR